MSMNIKNPRVHELARAASQATGRSQTSVVEAALERYLREVTGDADRRRRAERADEILDIFHSALQGQGPELRTAVEDLYDDATGLPR